MRALVEEIERRTHLQGLAVARQRQVHRTAPAVAAALGDVAAQEQFGLGHIGVVGRLASHVFEIAPPLDEVVHGALRAIRVVHEQ